MDNVEKTKKLINVINTVHQQYSQDYFDTGKVEKLNLTKTSVPTEHILNYRLNLHESINDYLATQDVENITYYYRVKTSESIIDKIKRYSENAEKYPINNWMNDIFGARMILGSEEIKNLENELDDLKESLCLKNWYKRETEEYRGVHIYFKSKSNFYFPWELQLWDSLDVENNIKNHRLFKRGFVENFGGKNEHIR
jgi:hypothetical protein